MKQRAAPASAAAAVGAQPVQAMPRSFFCQLGVKPGAAAQTFQGRRVRPVLAPDLPQLGQRDGARQTFDQFEFRSPVLIVAASRTR
jgi:hypothetical protein